MGFGAANPQVLMMNRLLPPRGPAVYSAGIKDADKSHVKYGTASTDQPNLTIISPIVDEDYNVILPGYYELILSYDRQMLSLVQSGKTIATFPVFKLEEDKSQEEVPQPTDNKSLRKYNKEEKKKEKKNKKLLKEGKILDVPQVYTNASIQYDQEGGYYLVKYERGKIRAWGAIK